MAHISIPKRAFLFFTLKIGGAIETETYKLKLHLNFMKIQKVLTFILIFTSILTASAINPALKKVIEKEAASTSIAQAASESYDQLCSDEVRNANPTFSLRGEPLRQKADPYKDEYVPQLSTLYIAEGTEPKSMTAGYMQALELAKQGEDIKAYKSFKKQAKKFKYIEDETRHLYYQLFHYANYGYFDLYYDGRPSDIDRTEIKKGNIAKIKDRYSSSLLNTTSILLLCGNPQFKTFDFDTTLHTATIYLSSPEHNDCLIAKSVLNAVCSPEREINIDLCQVVIDKISEKKVNLLQEFFPGTRPDKFDVIFSYAKLVPFLSRMKNTNSNSDIGKSASELFSMGKELEEKSAYDYDRVANLKKAIYYYTRAAMFGNMQAFARIYDAVDEHNTTLGDLCLKKEKFDPEMDLVISKTASAKKIYQSEPLSEFQQFSKKYYDMAVEEESAYHKRKREEMYAEMAAKEERKRRRWNLFGEILRTLGAGLSATLAQTNQFYQNSYSNSIPSTAVNNNYLLDPRFAIAQVNAQEMTEYQSARENHQRVFGTDISIDDWRAQRGQAIMDLKEEGTDILAQQQADWEERRNMRDQERISTKKEQLKRAGADNTDEVTNNNRTSKDLNFSAKHGVVNKTDNTRSKKTEAYRSQDNSKDLDSREQYKREDVSSSDYQHIKYVNLYYRDGKHFRKFMSNKDLCKKGARFFINIDGVYYLVRAGESGYTGTIQYSHSILYFNK